MNQLEIQNLHVSINSKQILNGVNLTIKKGEIHALMGPNGSGKSTLSLSIMGHPSYSVTEGSILYNGEDITAMPVTERALKKIFLAFQYPSSITGVSVTNFIRAAYLAQHKNVSFKDFSSLLQKNMEKLKITPAFLQRYLNEGFSGGEKKRAEILQLAMLEPELALLDETDSGLDIDALRIVSEEINAAKTDAMAILLVTHYQRILDYIHPDFVHVMYEGKIIRSGGSDLAKELEKSGYESIISEYKAHETAS
jgi:Fe-S cluster assembly ATP-binding protein